MSLLRKATLGAAASALLLTGSTMPALADAPAPQAPPGDGWVLVTSSGDLTAQARWSDSKSWGEASVKISLTNASGWIKDLAADGNCAQVVIKWYGAGGRSDTDYSPRACPKGDEDEFTDAPGDSSHWRARDYDIYMRKVAA